MDPALYIAAKSSNIDVLMHNKDKIVVEVTPNQNTVLHIASQFGKTECVREILTMHPSLLHRVNSSGESALHLAAKNGHYDVVLALVNCATSLDASELESGVSAVKEMLRLEKKDGDTALHEAVRYNRFDVVEFLTKNDSKYSYAANNDGETPLYIAVEGGFHELVEVILKTCKSPAFGGPGGTTALHRAVISKNKAVIRKLVDWDKSLVKKTDENGRTPLHYTAWFVSRDEQTIASQLLDADNSVAYVVDNDGSTALHLAAMKGNLYIIEEVESCTPDCWEIVNGKRQNILHIALKHGRKDTAKYILKNNIGINTLITQKDVDGNTPLHLMAVSDCFVPEIISQDMVAKNALNNRSLTPLDMVPDDGSDVESALKKAGAIRSRQKVMSKSHEERVLTVEEECKEAAENKEAAEKKEELAEKKEELVERKERQVEWKEELAKRKERQAEWKERLAEMRKISDTHIIVAALIVTVTFAAGFTMPGGYNQSGPTNPVPGMTVLSRKPAFRAFMISDAIALLLSCVAIFLNFWGTLARDARTVQMFAIVTTFLVTAAIVAMMIAFSTATYVVLAQSSTLAIVTCLVGVVSIPVSFLLCFNLGHW